ncbi:MAG: ComEC/Rec2 family competence protein [Planctomycetota bacterium]|jgi:competence protein ComEC
MPEAAANEEVRPQPARYQPLVIVLVAVCAGIAADRLWGPSVGAWWAVAASAWLVWILLWQLAWDRSAGVVLLTAAAACGGAWHHLRWQWFPGDELGRYAHTLAQPACVEVVALKGPRRRPAPAPDPMRMIPAGDRTEVEVAVRAVRDAARWRPARGRAKLTVDGHLLGVEAGDRLQLFAHLSAPRGADNPGDFDYAAHHRADRTLSLLRSEWPECVSVLRHASAGDPARWIETVRSAGDRLLWEHLDPRRAGLAAAVLLGAREEIGPDRVRAFMETGTVHLLAISGLHVGILAGVLFLAMRLMFVPQSRSAIVVAAATVLYTLLTDARPPAVRAMILVLALCASMILHRPRLAFNSLAAAGLVVLAVNPADLFRTGVHLSFICVAGLMWFLPGWFAATRRPPGLKRLLAENRSLPWQAGVTVGSWAGRLAVASTVIWLLTLPLVTARFHVVAPVAPALNVLLWPLMAGALFCGFGLLIFGWLVPPLGTALGWGCDQSLGLLESCIRSARDLPFSHFWVPGPADWWLWGFYGGLGALAAFPAIRPPRRWLVALAAGWIAAGLLPSVLRGARDQLDCTFLSVGHGCAVIVELPGGKTVLYDAGHFGSPAGGARSVASSLWSRGITHLDAVVLSHCDADHYNMLPHVLERFSVGVVYVSPVMFQRRSRAIDALEASIRTAKLPLREIFAGDRLEAGSGCLIEVRHPPRDRVLGGDNANSIVLAIEYLGRRILLTGDLEPPGLTDVLAEEPWPCDVLLAPHHGAGKSNPPGLAAWSRPSWVVVSGGLGSYQPGTTATYRAVGAEVLHTGEAGAVHCTIDAAGLRMSSHAPGPESR